MTTEQQNALPQTELGQQINKWADRIEPHTNRILFGALVLATAVVIGVVMYRGAKTSAESSWTAYLAADSADLKLNVANEFRETVAGVWARLSAGQQFMVEGVRQSFTDRDASDDRLKRAVECFEEVLKEKSAPKEAREQALRGLAVCLETQSDGSSEKNDAAIKAYDELIQFDPEGTHAKWAKHRIDQLKTGSVQEFYAWFRKQNPKPAAPGLPLDGLKDKIKKPGEQPAAFPAETTPDAEKTAEPAATPGEAPAAPAAEAPATPVEAPAIPAAEAPATPAAEAPATPAAEATPAEAPAAPAAETPAAETPAK